MELPTEWLPRLAAAGHARGLRFGLSVFDEALADLAERYVDFYKIASYKVTHLPLIRHVAAKGKPTVMSTGTAALEEVAEAVETFRATGNDQLCLMQCSAAYPAPFDALNLRSIPTMREAFGMPVGFSDHSRDPLVAPVAAVALGANLLEKHYTLANILPGPDHRFALEPRELVSMVAAVRATELALGTGEKVAMPVEEKLRQFARRTVFALRRLEAGEVLMRENTAVLRAGRHSHGLAPGGWEEVLGRRVCRTVQPETPLRWDDLDH